jgi:hypothetical protein
MKIRPKTGPQSGPFFRILNPDCCNLQSVRKLSSLIYIGFLAKSRLRIPDCGESAQSGFPPNKSTTYEKFQIARTPLSLREREINTAYAGLPLVESSLLHGKGCAV